MDPLRANRLHVTRREFFGRSACGLGTAALAGLPPLKAVSVELDVPHRTAGDWIRHARKAGQLEGMNYNVGRQADG